MRDYPLYDKLKQLIPQNCFCGTAEIIPGLNNDYMPIPKL